MSEVRQISPLVVVILKICRIWVIDAVNTAKSEWKLRELVKHTSRCSVFSIVSAHLLCESTTDKLSVSPTPHVGHHVCALATVLSGLYLLQSRCVAQCLDLSPQLVYGDHRLGLLSNILNWLPCLLRLCRRNFSWKILAYWNVRDVWSLHPWKHVLNSIHNLPLNGCVKVVRCCIKA